MFNKIIFVVSLSILLNPAFSNYSWDKFIGSEEFIAFDRCYKDFDVIYTSDLVPRHNNDSVYNSYLMMQDITNYIMTLPQKNDITELMQLCGRQLTDSSLYRPYVNYLEEADKFPDTISSIIKQDPSLEFSANLTKVTFSSIISGDIRPLKTVKSLLDGIALALQR